MAYTFDERMTRNEDDAIARCRELIGAFVCSEVTEAEFAGAFVDCLIDAPIMAAKRASRGMLRNHLELLLPYLEVIESSQGLREHRGFNNDGMGTDERKQHYEITAEHALDVCLIIRNNYHKTVEQDATSNGG